MTNDFDGQAWSENHQHVSRGLSGIFDKLSYAFKRLQAIEYDAPWEREAKRVRDTRLKRARPVDPSIGRAASFR